MIKLTLQIYTESDGDPEVHWHSKDSTGGSHEACGVAKAPADAVRAALSAHAKNRDANAAFHQGRCDAERKKADAIRRLRRKTPEVKR